VPNSISAGELTALSRDPLAGLRAYFYGKDRRRRERRKGEVKEKRGPKGKESKGGKVDEENG